MAEYQNIFTQVQVQGPPEMGMVEDADPWRPHQAAPASRPCWAGSATRNLGPIYLGPWGVLSLMAGAIWFVMVGFWFWEQADYNPAVFMRDLFWLSLDPPSPEYGLGIPPLAEGGYYLIASLLPAGVGDRVVDPDLRAGRTSWAWASTSAMGLRLGDLAVPCARSVPADPDGVWSEAVPYGIFTHLDWTNLFSLTYGNLFYNPFHALSIVVPLWLGPAVRDARCDDPGGHPLRRRPRD